MIIDAHVHISNETSPKVPHSSFEKTIEYMDKAGVDKVIGFLYDPISLNENIRFMKNVEKYRHRIIPYAWLDPNDPDVSEQLQYCLDDLGMKGLKLHPLVSKFDLGDPELMDPIMTPANKRRLHVIIHCTSNETLVDTAKVEALAQKYPDCIIQLAHIGAIYDGNKAIAVAKKNDNVYLDTGCASMNCIRRAILEVPDKVLMGCDWPSYTFEMEMKKIEDACILAGREEVFAKVCGENAEKILNR